MKFLRARGLATRNFVNDAYGKCLWAATAPEVVRAGGDHGTIATPYSPRGEGGAPALSYCRRPRLWSRRLRHEGRFGAQRVCSRSPRDAGRQRAAGGRGCSRPMRKLPRPGHAPSLPTPAAAPTPCSTARPDGRAATLCRRATAASFSAWRCKARRLIPAPTSQPASTPSPRRRTKCWRWRDHRPRLRHHRKSRCDRRWTGLQHRRANAFIEAEVRYRNIARSPTSARGDRAHRLDQYCDRRQSAADPARRIPSDAGERRLARLAGDLLRGSRRCGLHHAGGILRRLFRRRLHRQRRHPDNCAAWGPSAASRTTEQEYLEIESLVPRSQALAMTVMRQSAAAARAA